MQAMRVVEKVARHRHAQLSTINLAGDVNAKGMEGLSIEEAIELLKFELRKLGPRIDLDAIREQQGVENRLPMTVNGSEPGGQAESRHKVQHLRLTSGKGPFHGVQCAHEPVAVAHAVLRRLAVGMTERLSKTVASSDVIGFAQLTGDRNPIHLSEHFADRLLGLWAMLSCKQR
jgi:MaoC like domain